MVRTSSIGLADLFFQWCHICLAPPAGLGAWLFDLNNFESHCLVMYVMFVVRSQQLSLSSFHQAVTFSRRILLPLACLPLPALAESRPVAQASNKSGRQRYSKNGKRQREYVRIVSIRSVKVNCFQIGTWSENKKIWPMRLQRKNSTR